MKKVEITFELSVPLCKVVVGSLKLETGRAVPKTQVNIYETDVGAALEIEAETTNALRAALNSYLRWLDCILTITNDVNIARENLN